MDAQVVKQQKIGKNYDIIKLSIQDGIEISEALPILLQTIDACFQQYAYKVILDMQRIKFPTSSFIAFLIEITARARRVGGEIKLINLAPSATNNLVTFSPLSYLAVEADETLAVEDLDALVVKRPEPQADSEENKETPTLQNPAAPTEPPADVQLPKTDTAEKTSLPDLAKPGSDTNENTPKAESDPEFKIKEVKIELPDFSVPQKSPRVQGESETSFHASVVRNTSDPALESEAPQTKEIVIQPPLEKKQKPDHPGKSTHHLKKPASEKTDAKPDFSESARHQKMEIPTVKRIRVKSKIESLYDICDFVTALADKVGFSEKEVGKIKVTVYEACINVIEHAYHSDPDEWIVTTVQYNSEDFTIIIQDWGESFNFDDSKPYDVTKAVHDRKTGGFGLFIILRSMDEVKYKTDPVNGNRLILRKKIPPKS